MIEQKIKALIVKLESENADRSELRNGGDCGERMCIILTHTYNNTLSIIKQLEEIIK